MWEMIYEKAIRDDGSLFFPERLSKEFLDQQHKMLGSYIFANQYQNVVIPDDAKSFKKEWFRYFETIPAPTNTFVFIDPAIGTDVHNDFTALVVIKVDEDKKWYVVAANRYKISPTEIVNLVFKANQVFKPMVIGIEEVAYQKALLYMCAEEMQRRGEVVPVKGIKPDTSKSKSTRILSLVPRFEFGRIYFAQGLTDLEMELGQFPRGAHDDLIDSLAYMDEIVVYPQKPAKIMTDPAPNDPGYESWYIKNLLKKNKEAYDGESY